MYLGIDWGTKKIGLAIGSEIPYELATLDNNEDVYKKIAKLCEQEKVERIVIGMPIMDSGEEGNFGDRIEAFARKLKEITKKAIYFEPENLTTQTALELLREGGATAEEIESKVDQLSARLILEQYIANKEETSQEAP